MVKVIRVAFVALLSMSAGSLLAQFNPADPFIGNGQLQLEGSQDDYITGGRTYSVGPTEGRWTAQLSGPDGGAPNFVLFSFLDDDLGSDQTGGFWHLQFGVDQVPGAVLAPGTYLDAQRAPFADDGHPGIDIGGDGRGCNTIAGEFTITAFEYDCTGNTAGGNTFHLTRFAATFRQHCERGTASLQGSIDWTADPSAIPCDGTGGGGDGGGETPEPPPPPPPFQFNLPVEFAVEPLKLTSNETRVVKLTTGVLPTFNSDLHLSVVTNASPTDDFHAEITPAFIAAPGVGNAELTIRTGPFTYPRTYSVTLLGTAGEEIHGSSFEVAVQCTPPFILGVNQPANVVAAAGTQGTLRSKVSGSGPFLYQWYSGFPGMTRSPVATTGADLSVPSGSGNYWLRVRNPCGSVDSNGASVNP